LYFIHGDQWLCIRRHFESNDPWKVGPSAYASRTSNGAYLNYSTVEKECSALVRTCKEFRPYLLGKPLQIWTDHKGLIWIFNAEDPSSRLLRWRLLLEEYEFEIKYKPGKTTNADSLSRYPVCTLEKTEVTAQHKQRILKMNAF
jgi:hypothetical protein